MLPRFTLVLVLVATGLCFNASAENILQDTEGIQQNVNIINPDYTNISNFPFTVAVVTGMYFLGGGALVRPCWVVTAASVVESLNVADLRVRVGSNSPSEGGNLFRVVQVIMYPDYTTNRSNNVALLQLTSQVNPKVAKPISALARVPFNDNQGCGNITGYGRTKSLIKNVASKSLEIVKMELLTNPFCNLVYNVNVPNVQFCGYNYYYVPCLGDEGDPLTRCVSRNQCELLGVYTGFNEYEISSVCSFVDIGQFYRWIRPIVNL